MRLIINSKTLGYELEFYIHNNYIKMETKMDKCTKQICKGGGTYGISIGYDGDDYEKFRSICKNWYRAYLKLQLKGEIK
jgi:hypothetical protein